MFHPMNGLIGFVLPTSGPLFTPSNINRRRFNTCFTPQHVLNFLGSSAPLCSIVTADLEQHTNVQASTSNCSRAPLLSKTSGNPLLSTRRQFLRLVTAGLLTSAPLLLQQNRAIASDVSSVYELSPLKNGKPYPLSEYRGKVTLFVNVASYCALTPQYKGLVALHDAYQTEGFEIIAAPCNQFARQEPNTNEEICSSVKQRFGARFLLLDKLAVNESPNEGPVAPLYKYLRNSSPERPGGAVLWNFEKFLVGSEGNVLRRYKPGVFPENIEADIKFALTHPGTPLPPKAKPSLGVA